MRGRLVDRHDLAEQVQVAEQALLPRPLDRLRHLIRGGVAGQHRLMDLRQAQVVVGQQFVDPVMGAAGDRAVGRQQPRVGQGQRPGQRAEVVAQRHPVTRGLESDRGGDVREHVIAGEHDLGRGVVEDEMAAGVTGRVNRAERPRPQVEVGPVGQPAVRVLPVDDRRAVPVQLGKFVGQLRCAQPAQALTAEDLVTGVVAADHFPGGDQVRALLLAQRDQAAEVLPQLDGERVVVDVNVGHEEVADVAELIADLPQRRGEPLPGRDQRYPGVDQVDAAGVGDRVDVDRPQPVQRQWQRDPVHAPAEVLDLRLGPGVPVSRNMAHRVADPSFGPKTRRALSYC